MFPLISIIVPAYNIEQYLPECLNSILKQSFKNYEIIIIDDGSTDKTGVICDQYAKINSKVQVIHKVNEGLSVARNQGILKAKGKYLAFLDGDDWLADFALQNLINRIVESDYPDIVVNQMKGTPDIKTPIYKKENSFDLITIEGMDTTQQYQYFINLKWFCTAAVLFVVRRDFLLAKNLFFVKGLLHEDEHWCPKIFLSAKNIGFNNSLYYINRTNREGSITQTLTTKRVFDKLWIINDLIAQTNPLIKNERNFVVLKQRCQQLYTGILFEISLYQNNPKYDKLLQEVEKNLYILNFGKIIKYRGLYWVCKLFGIRKIGTFLYKLKQLKLNGGVL